MVRATIRALFIKVNFYNEIFCAVSLVTTIYCGCCPEVTHSGLRIPGLQFMILND